MSIRLGPILYAGTSDPTAWRFCVQLAVDDAPCNGRPAYSVQSADADVTVSVPQLVADFTPRGAWRIWKWPVAVRRTPQERTIAYTIRGDTGQVLCHVDNVAVPKQGCLPRLVLCSCNGFSEARVRRRVAEPAQMWQIMRERHLRGLSGTHRDDPSGFHLLIGAGDQIYADQIEVVRELDDMAWKRLKQLRHSAAWEDRAQRQYLAKYAQVWAYEEIAYMMARVPGIFTWDDHEILDGWGSHDDRIQQHPRYQSLYRAARKAFLACQLSGDPDEATTPPHVYRTSPLGTPGGAHLLQTLSFREADRWVDLVLLDLRSHRTQDEVLSACQWQDLQDWLAQYAQAAAATPHVPRHLLLVSSIPLVYLRFRVGDWVLRHLIPGVQDIEDDLRDQWEHPSHEGERARLIMTLLATRKAANTQVTVLSGDVHVAARGRIVSIQAAHRHGSNEQQAVIHQITSSAIVHPAPSPFEFAVIEGFGTEGRHHVSDGVYTELVALDSQHTRLCTRNFVAVAFDEPQGRRDAGRLWAEWIAEDRRARAQLVVSA